MLTKEKKNKMKKLSIILVVLLSFTMLFGLTACNNDDSGETPPVIYPYTVTFNTNGGSAVESKNTDVIMYSPTSIKENYILEGWYFDSQRTVPAQFPLSVDSNFTLYAKWKETFESMRKRFIDYMDTVDNKVEKNYIDGNFSFEFKLTNIGKYITFSWKRVYTDSTDSNYNSTYNFSMNFEFGDFTTVNGTVSFIHNDNAGICSAGFNCYSSKLEGNTHVLNLHNTLMFNSSSTNYNTAWIEKDIQAALVGALADVKSAVGFEFYSYILDYNYVY